jgi:hypothetical protein
MIRRLTNFYINHQATANIPGRIDAVSPVDVTAGR